MDSALLTSDSPNWGTPRPFLKNLCASLLFEIGLDTCARTGPEAVAELFYSPEQNGLVNTWKNPNFAWCNPPYGRDIIFWIKKAVREWKAGAKVAMLLPARTDTEWFSILDKHADLYFVKGRISFIDLDSNAKLCPAPFPSVVAILDTPKNKYNKITNKGILL